MVLMKIRVFWNTTCRRVNCVRHFGGAFCLHFQGQTVKKADWPWTCSNHTRLYPLLLCANQNAVAFQTLESSSLTSVPFHKETWKSPILYGCQMATRNCLMWMRSFKMKVCHSKWHIILRIRGVRCNSRVA